jgi:IclR family acetate operon transcriptional repressor
MKTADRTLEIFEAFAEVRRPLSLSEVARRIETPVSSCHGLLKTLQRSGYLYTLANRRRYYPTRRLFDVGKSISGHDPVVERLAGLMQRLRDQTGETLLLGQRAEDRILYLHVIESPQIIRYTAAAGDLRPLTSSSVGKAFLGEMADEELAQYLREYPPSRFTPTTIVDPDQLMEDIRRSRKRGYFVTHGETVADVMAVARVFRLESESIALAVAGPMHRMEPRVRQIGEMLIEAERDIALTTATSS